MYDNINKCTCPPFLGKKSNSVVVIHNKLDSSCLHNILYVFSSRFSSFSFLVCIQTITVKSFPLVFIILKSVYCLPKQTFKKEVKSYQTKCFDFKVTFMDWVPVWGSYIYKNRRKYMYLLVWDLHLCTSKLLYWFVRGFLENNQDILQEIWSCRKVCFSFILISKTRFSKRYFILSVNYTTQQLEILIKTTAGK